MSGFFGAALPVNMVRADDRRIFPAQMRADIELSRTGEDAGNIASYANAYWPGGGFMGGQGNDVGIMDSMMWAPYDDTFGICGASRYGYVGVTRDQNGSPIDGCNVKAFRTADDSKIDETVSDPLGNYLLNTPYNEAHWIVSHKTGSPDVDGVTVNTLLPT